MDLHGALANLPPFYALFTGFDLSRNRQYMSVSRPFSASALTDVAAYGADVAAHGAEMVQVNARLPHDLEHSLTLGVLRTTHLSSTEYYFVDVDKVDL